MDRDSADVRLISLGSFAEYVNISGSERMRRISDQYTWYTDAARPAFLPYQAAAAGIRKTVRDNDLGALQVMIGRATDVMRSHYEELATGMRRFMAAHRPAFIETPATTWAYGELTLNVHQHIGMQIKGTPCIVFPYLKQPALTPDGAKVIWRTLELASEHILPGGRALVLDVRRSKIFRPHARTSRPALDRWILAEASGYVEHWRQVAASSVAG